MEFARAKKEVWDRRRVVVVIEVGSRFSVAVSCSSVCCVPRNLACVVRRGGDEVHIYETYIGRRTGCGRGGIGECSELLSG